MALTEETFIPIIDMRWLEDGRSRDFGAALRKAFEASGFCYITGHGVPHQVITDVREEALAFFHLPLDTKLESKPKQSVRGFNAIGRTKMQYAAQPDYKEFYQIGLELGEDDPLVLSGQALRGPNRWPEGRLRFRQAFERYFLEIGQCGQRLLRGVALSLDIPEDFFITKYDRPLQRTQAVFYPPHPAEVGSELFGVAPHTDYGCITLLWQDDVGGLEVMNRQGQWVSAPPIPDTLVINIGDLLQRWSNDRYFSNQHRVTNRSGRERLSIATFYDPDYVASVDPKDLNLPEGAAVRYPSVSAGDYITGRIQASQRHNSGDRSSETVGN